MHAAEDQGRSETAAPRRRTIEQHPVGRERLQAVPQPLNELFRDAAKGPLAGILGFEHRPLVSADYTNDTRSSIVDGPSTMVTDGTLLKVYAWYDNEVGYACRMIDLANIVIERGL
jgi:glyceraldehyde 3-phosphate dehydrogenase